jgi:hypothetical protein
MSRALLATAPALPLHKAGPYVAAAYIVFVVLLLVYLAIMGVRTSRTERQLAALRAQLRERAQNDGGAAGDGARGRRDGVPDRRAVPEDHEEVTV